MGDVESSRDQSSSLLCDNRVQSWKQLNDRRVLLAEHHSLITLTTILKV